MFRVILRGFLSRKLRSALTAAAIFLGVAMISGTFVLTDKINAAFSDIFKTGNKNVDVSITKQAAFGADASNGGGGVPFDAAVVDRIEQVSGVRQVAAAAESSGFLVKGSHKLTSQGGRPRSCPASSRRASPPTRRSTAPSRRGAGRSPWIRRWPRTRTSPSVSVCSCPP
jgi:putative ABC transport system permease protein